LPPFPTLSSLVMSDALPFLNKLRGITGVWVFLIVVVVAFLGLSVIPLLHQVRQPRCHFMHRISLLFTSLEVTARLKSVDDLELLMNVLESNRAFFVKNDRLAAEVLTLT
jgi:hypothetical protein